MTKGQEALVTCQQLCQVPKEENLSDGGNMCVHGHVHETVNLENGRNPYCSQKQSPHCCYGKAVYKIGMICQSLDFYYKNYKI